MRAIIPISCACDLLSRVLSICEKFTFWGRCRQWLDDQGSCKANQFGSEVIYSPYFERSLKDTSRRFHFFNMVSITQSITYEAPVLMKEAGEHSLEVWKTAS